ncbi:MAG: dihydropteroate synthase [Desulfomonile tiedjei]|nr:dihydropteroate synthase [Desulfomonile tiedjei]
MLLAADNLHGLNPVVADAMNRLDPKPIQELVRRCELGGAKLIDINPGYLSRRNEDRMVFLVEAVQEVTSARLILDSPNPRVIQRGLAACKEKPIVTGISLEERKLGEILPLAAENGAELVVLLMDERSFTPPGLEEKIALAVELAEKALAAGLGLDDLIFDPILPNLSWEDAFPRISEDVKAIRLLSSGAVFQDPAPTMVGLSNLRSGNRNRYPFALEKTCMALLAGAGLHLMLADVLQPHFSEAFEALGRML